MGAMHLWSGRLPRALLDRRGGPLSTASARGRTSAFVYGNVTVLGALATVDVGGAASGGAALVVLSTAVATFAAHVLADSVAHRIGSLLPHRRRWRVQVLDASPILTSGAAPAAVLSLAALGVLTPTSALTLASAIIVVRLAVTGPIVERLSGRPASAAGVWGGVGLAVLGALIVAIKSVGH